MNYLHTQEKNTTKHMKQNVYGSSKSITRLLRQSANTLYFPTMFFNGIVIPRESQCPTHKPIILKFGII